MLLQVKVLYFIAGKSIIAVLCSILSTYLLTTSDYESSPSHNKQLFILALDNIKAIGAAHPQHFKAVMVSSAPLKSSIEQAFLLHQTTMAAAQKTLEEANKRKSQQSKPSIQLKMNFGNFK